MSIVNFCSIKNNCEAASSWPVKRVQRIPAKTPWGIALERLRERVSVRLGKDFSQYALAKKADIQLSQYSAMLQRGKLGPSILGLQNLLDAMGFNWHDWANEFESLKRMPIHDEEKAKPVKGGSRK